VSRAAALVDEIANELDSWPGVRIERRSDGAAPIDNGGSEDAVSQANVELVRRVYEAFGRGDVDALFAAMEPDIEWDESEGMPYGGVYRGREAIVENVFGPILADVEEFTADPDEILRLDDARVMARGRHGGNGARGPVDARFVHIWTVTDGKVSRYEQLADTRRFCDAVGK
jgi:ketosteroid isomerase-like protein